MPLDFYLRLNGRDVADLDAEPLDPIVAANPGQRRNLVSTPGQMGVRAEAVSLGQPQRIAIALALKTSVSIDERQEKVDAILAWVRRPGLTEIQMGTSPHRVWGGLLEAAAVRPRWESVAMQRGPAIVDLAYLIQTGTADGRELSVLGLAADVWTSVDGLGTVPSDPLIFVPGGVGAPEIDVARADRSEASSLALTGQIPVDGWWEVDVALRRVVERVAAGSRTDKTSAANPSGSWPVLDPAYGLEGIPPLIRSTRPALVYYTPRWWIG